MPIFEYICKKCSHQFEALVQGNKSVACPSCQSKQLEKQLSVFATSVKGQRPAQREIPMAPCGQCGDPRGPGSCSSN